MASKRLSQGALAESVRRMMDPRAGYRAKNSERFGQFTAQEEAANAAEAQADLEKWKGEKVRGWMARQAEALGVPPQTTANLISMTDYFPVVGDATAVEDASIDIGKARRNPTMESILTAGGMSAAAAVGAVPLVGDAASLLMRGAIRNVGKGAAKGAGKKAAAVVRKAKKGSNAHLPNLRELPTDEAVKLAKRETHLIPSAEDKAGAYIGGPAAIKDRKDLLRMRRALDENIARGAPGADWYDRVNDYVNRVAGPDGIDQATMARQHAMFSAGVGPEVELGFATRANNSHIAKGVPDKVARPAQQKAQIAAARTNNPLNYMLGDKTGLYGQKIDPSGFHFPETPPSVGHNGGPPMAPTPSTPGRATPGATGVNDRWHARLLGAEIGDGPAGTAADGYSTPMQHRWMDWETAAAVGRANKKQLGGLSNWNGERLQASSWVQARADKYFNESPDLWMKRGSTALGLKNTPANREAIEAKAKELAFAKSNLTLRDFERTNSANATHEYQTYAGLTDTGHLPGMANADDATKARYAAEANARATDEMGRDRLYAGMRHYNEDGVGTGVAMRVAPTTHMRGLYTPPSGVVETNPGFVARPLVGYEPIPKGMPMAGERRTPAADKSLLDGVEALRGYINGQGATPYHRIMIPKAMKNANAVSLTRPPSISNTEELLGLQAQASQTLGLGNAADTGRGFTLADFEGQTQGRIPSMPVAERSRAVADLGRATNSRAELVRVDGGYPGYEGTWEAGVGSDAASKQMLEYYDALPAGTRTALDRNPEVPRQAIDRMLQDVKYGKQFGGTREDLQFARKLIGEGPGWADRIRGALGKGLLPAALVGAILGPVLMQQGQTEGPSGL